jgi:hypothetical protein
MGQIPVQIRWTVLHVYRTDLFILKYKNTIWLYLSLRVMAGYRTELYGLIYGAKCVTTHLFLSQQKVGYNY